jgi:hypothetical protein
MIDKATLDAVDAVLRYVGNHGEEAITNLFPYTTTSEDYLAEQRDRLAKSAFHFWAHLDLNNRRRLVAMAIAVEGTEESTETSRSEDWAFWTPDGVTLHASEEDAYRAAFAAFGKPMPNIARLHLHDALQDACEEADESYCGVGVATREDRR